ncbi:hypothetical protein CEQ90_05000 [Lewinellaceae bacterium SD302]|nr:hypothetical protein CEQ90_05000 [Lewinellaceae bacterium SD302]
MRFITLLLFFSLFACQSSDSEAASESMAEDTATALAKEGKIDPNYQVDADAVPRTAGCTFISDEKLIEIIAGEDAENTSISSSPGSTVSACVYRLENPRWSADLAVEMTDGARSNKVIKQVEEASPAEKATVHGKAAQFLSDNRILRVVSGPPYELKLSILPKAGFEEYADAAARREMLEAMAMAINER